MTRQRKHIAKDKPQTGAAHADRMKWWLHDRFGMFIHWGLYAVPARGEWVRNKEKISVEQYQQYFDEFNPVRYDPARWAALARRAGQKYAVMTAKHHDGFCLFDSQHTDYKATNTPARRDLVRQYVEAFRAEGLKVGFYYSLLDWRHPDYPADNIHPMREDEKFKAGERDFGRYLDYFHAQVRELLTNYGRIDILWLDFSYGDLHGEAWRASELVRMARKLQPHIILDNRLGNSNAKALGDWGDFASPEQFVPAAGVTDSSGAAVPWEACITINDNWGYARDDRNFKSSAQIIRMLVECVSKGGNLLLNVGPTATGEIQPEFIQRLEEVGLWMERNGASVYGCGNAGLPKPDWGCYTRCGGTLYAHILSKPVGHVVLVALGGKVRKARLLADGSEVSISRPWNVSAENVTDAFLNTGPIAPDPLDTVVALEMSQ